MADETLQKALTGIKAVIGMLADIVPTDDPVYKHLGWRSGGEADTDKTGLVFSDLRVRALAALNRMQPQPIKLILTGGKTNTEENVQAPTIAEVVEFELMEMGVPANAIVTERTAYTSVEQLINSAKICRSMNWKADEIAILAPFWQAARIYAQLEHLPDEKLGPAFAPYAPIFFSMERVLAAEDPAWNDRFTALYSTDEARRMFASELLGAGQLWAGHQPRFPKPFRGFADPLL